MNTDYLVNLDVQYPKCAGTANAEKMLLHSVLRHIQPEKVLEIGVSAGHMTCWLAGALKANGKGHLTSVDNFSKAHGGEADKPEIPLSRLKKAKLEHFVTFVKSDSVAYLKAQQAKSFDFIWVDGDHSFDGAFADIKEALRVAKVGIGVHDVGQQYDGPRKAVEAIEKKYRVKGITMPGYRGTWLLML